ncbi:uncharacterized protein LOC126980689 [Eriocheir sinensis]|uniref:uncharacterized protein LOC126980689 n=1 Tax=Eriocheir sinensis TaxID=95602 RepID=UPI0021C5EA48|nr:uncharacterized protein LOC126980689 [Eriocheir sinensis]
MEKILDEWTPYASINHIEAGRWHTPRAGLRGRGGLGGRGEFIGLGAITLSGKSEIGASNPKRGLAGGSLVQRKEYIGRREKENGFGDLYGNERGGEMRGVTGSNRHTFPEGDRRDTRARHKTITSGDQGDGRESSVDYRGGQPWRYRQDKVPTIRRNHYGSVEDKIMRRRDELQVTTARTPTQHRTNWLTEATIRKLEDYHSDNLSDVSYTTRKTALSVPKAKIPVDHVPLASREEMNTYKPRRPPFDLQKEKEHGEEGEGKRVEQQEVEEEEEYGFVKRGILFWDAERRRREEESEKKVLKAKWTEKEPDKCVREEEWIYKEQDTVWVAKADRNIRMKNQRERKLEAERMFTENKRVKDMRERKYETRKANKTPGNYWRIGYGDRGLNKELKVVRISDEQLTSF